MTVQNNKVYTCDFCGTCADGVDLEQRKTNFWIEVQQIGDPLRLALRQSFLHICGVCWNNLGKKKKEFPK